MQTQVSQSEVDVPAQRANADSHPQRMDPTCCAPPQGKRLGRARSLPAAVTARVVPERASGMTMAAIADGLIADSVPTARGGARWYPSTVAAVLRSAALDEAAA